MDYEKILDSDIPEEIILAILCDFKEENANEVLVKIIGRLRELSRDEITLKKYIRQILVLSRLRDLTTLTTKQLKNMAIIYDVEKDVLYKKGEELGLKKGEELGLKKGEELGLKKGEELGLKKTKIQGVQKALAQKILTLAQIADLFEVSEEFILKVQRGEIV
jgi:predicted transposase YdaD